MPLQPLGGLLRTAILEQIVGSQYDDHQTRIGREAGAIDGISWLFCLMLEIVHLVSAARIFTHRQSVS